MTTSQTKNTAPFPSGYENIVHPNKDAFFELHKSGEALIEKLGTLQWRDREICYKEWDRFVDAFNAAFATGATTK